MLKIGILGAARIAPWAVIEPARRRKDVEIRAVAARRPGKAKEFADVHEIPVVYDSYEAMISDPDIDVIYNPLLPNAHAEYSIKALEAGKHVLCEKPFAMNIAEAHAMNDAAKSAGKRIIEAFHDRYHPVFKYVMDLKASGRLGKIKTLHAAFSHTIPYSDDEFRHQPKMGGGALMDLGCYPVHWCRNFMEDEPIVESATAKLTEAGVDEEICAVFSFKSGVKATIESRMSPGWDYYARFVVEAENGSVTLINSILPHLGHSIIERLDGNLREFTLAGNSSFDHQLADLVTALETGEPMVTEGQNPIGNIQAIGEIYRAAGVSILRGAE